MVNINSISYNSLENVPIEEKWNFGRSKEKKMHKIHAYPAKFPAFIADLAFEYALNEGVELKKVADIFCGCGTVALEARRKGIDFWGCDINPVATLIAKVKSKGYSKNILNKYYSKILKSMENDVPISEDIYSEANERLKYWFAEKSYISLYKIKKAIISNTPKGNYRDAFMCLFSSILKPSSRWLTKSIKPQVDPSKQEIDVIQIFQQQYDTFIKSIEELSFSNNTIADIKNKNFLKYKDIPKVDMIISSPPYVTSYEYADLHQLSTLWLGYAEDYRDLREGSIGSIYNSDIFDFDLDKLNSVGKSIVEQLIIKKISNVKIKSVARYFSDMQNTINKCYEMLNENGMVFFVIGDTEYKGVKIQNSSHLIESLKENHFSDIKISRRKISNKLLSSYRDENGKFTSDKKCRKIYHEEFVISGRKLNDA